MRNALDLFVNVVHCKSVEGVETRHKNVDIVVIRWGHNTPLSNLIYFFSNWTAITKNAILVVFIGSLQLHK